MTISGEQGADSRGIWISGILGAIVAAALNALVVIVATRVLGIDAEGDFPPLQGLGPVVMFTLFFLLLATLVYWLIARRADDPLSAFRAIAIAVLPLSFLPDLLMIPPPGGVPEALTLMLTHVIAAAVIYAAFRFEAQRSITTSA